MVVQWKDEPAGVTSLSAGDSRGLDQLTPAVRVCSRLLATSPSMTSARAAKVLLSLGSGDHAKRVPRAFSAEGGTLSNAGSRGSRRGPRRCGRSTPRMG